jgi:hypothetical protein
METKEYIRQKNNPGALLNVDSTGLAAYKRQREIMRNVTTHEDRIKKIESSIDEVKNLLLQLVENGK